MIPVYKLTLFCTLQPSPISTPAATKTFCPRMQALAEFGAAHHMTEVPDLSVLADDRAVVDDRAGMCKVIAHIELPPL